MLSDIVDTVYTCIVPSNLEVCSPPAAPASAVLSASATAAVVDALTGKAA